MIKQTIISLTAAVGLTMTAYADLGDTMASSEAKYGTGSKSPTILHEMDYRNNGWEICELFNDNGICVWVQFVKLNGLITPKNRRNMDVNNLPDYINTINGNGWVRKAWPDSSNTRKTFEWIWTNGNVLFQVTEGLNKYGTNPQWYDARTYLTGEGAKLLHDDLAAADTSSNQAQPAEVSDSPNKDNI